MHRSSRERRFSRVIFAWLAEDCFRDAERVRERVERVWFWERVRIWVDWTRRKVSGIYIEKGDTVGHVLFELLMGEFESGHVG